MTEIGMALTNPLRGPRIAGTCYKKAFYLNVKCSLADSASYIVNKFKYVPGARALYSEVQVD